MLSTVIALLSLALLCLPLPTAAQAAPPTELDTLTRVRLIRYPLPGGRFVGRLIAADTAGVVIERGGTLQRRNWAEIRRVEISMGKSRRGVARGAGEGLATSLLLLGFYYVLPQGECEDCLFTPRSLVRAAGLPVVLAITAVGALSGFERIERWKRVPLPLHVRPSEASSDTTSSAAEQGAAGDVRPGVVPE